MEQFYRLTLSQAIADRQAGKLTTYGLLDYYIRIKTSSDPRQKLILCPHEVCQELNISLRQFRRAVSKVGLDADLSKKVNFIHVAYLFNQNQTINS